MSNYYRKIWESANGQIPKDKNGRSYEIHHIDGNRSNNKLSNLMCVSIEDHIKIHMNQGELGAVQLITKRLNLSYEKYMEAICKRVNQYDLNGNYIKTWPSCTIASKELNIAGTRITAVCRGKKYRKTAGGFIWKYSK
jgi:predicted DNA-binding ArsR family transcriptional regulator